MSSSSYCTMIGSLTTAAKMCLLQDTTFQTPFSLATLPVKNGDHVRAFCFCFYISISLISLVDTGYTADPAIQSHHVCVTYGWQERRGFWQYPYKKLIDYRFNKLFCSQGPIFTTIKYIMWEHRICYSQFWCLNHQIIFSASLSVKE